VASESGDFSIGQVVFVQVSDGFKQLQAFF
jgi:hypothetical protein